MEERVLPRSAASALPRRALLEELANTVTHGLGAVASFFALNVMVVWAALRGNAWHVTGCAVFGGSLVTLYVASTIYHGAPAGPLKALLRTVEQVCIYLLIAGTYTPFALTVMRGGLGWTVLGLVWGLALAGSVTRVLVAHRYPAVTVAGYVFLGWLGVIIIRPLMQAIPLEGVLWVVGGGVAYTVGLVFFLLDERVPFFHALWHVFVLIGSTCHVLAVLLYVVPR
jgi:hemolysin III